MASKYIEDSSGEEREGFRRGGGSRGRGRGGRSSGSGGGRRGGGSRGRGRGSRSKGSKGRGSRSARGASTKGAKSRSRSAARSKSRGAQRSATKSQAASRAKSRAPSGKPSVKDITGPTKTKAKTNFKSKDKLRDASGMLTRAGVAANKVKKAAAKAKAANVNKASYDKLKSLAKAKNITNEQLRSLKDMNVKMGLNPTTGMGVKQSFAYRGPQLTKDINNLKDLYGKLPTPGNIAMKALGMFGKKPAAPKTSVADIAGPNPNAPKGIGGFFSGLKDKFNMGPSTVTPDKRGGGGGPNNQMISDMLLRPTVEPGGIGGQFKQPSPTVMPGMENLQQLEQKFGNDGIGNLLARAQQVPTTNYGYGASATAGRENLDRLTASPSYMPLSSFMTAADGGRAGYSEGGSGTEQQQRENFYDFGYDDFLSLEQYMGSAQALRDLERNANGGRIGYQYGGTGAYPSGEVYGGNYAQGGQAQSGSPMVMMTGANSGLGNVLEHYKTIRGKM